VQCSLTVAAGALWVQPRPALRALVAGAVWTLAAAPVGWLPAAMWGRHHHLLGIGPRDPPCTLILRLHHHTHTTFHQIQAPPAPPTARSPRLAKPPHRNCSLRPRLLPRAPRERAVRLMPPLLRRSFGFSSASVALRRRAASLRRNSGSPPLHHRHPKLAPCARHLVASPFSCRRVSAAPASPHVLHD
jgi:hypothetical protein